MQNHYDIEELEMKHGLAVRGMKNRLSLSELENIRLQERIKNMEKVEQQKSFLQKKMQVVTNE